MFPMQPGCIGITGPLFSGTVKLLAVQMDVVTQVFVPWATVELSDSEGAIAQISHRLCKVRTASALNAVGLTMD